MTDQEVRDFRAKVREHYWEGYKETDVTDDDRWNDYIKHFLPFELRRAAERGRLPKDGERRQILILLVGYTLEPLLQSICAWQPRTKEQVVEQKVVLVLNRYYGSYSGQVWGGIIKDLIQKLVEQGRLDAMPEVASIELKEEHATLKGDHPANVFHCLRKSLLSLSSKEQTVLDLVRKYGRKQVVLDITGGKKSMVAGAYLFGAYADVDVSYVDFDDDAYEPKYGKPYGDACKIGVMEDPFKLFGLRDWQRVEELYQRHAFRAAREQVLTLIRGMKGLFDPEEIKAAKKLSKALKVYEEWDRGDYRKADATMEKLGFSFTAPVAIKELSNGTTPWPNARKTAETQIPRATVQGTADHILDQVKDLALGYGGDFKGSLYLDQRVVIYAEDDLARSRRLLRNADYRSAYITAYGVFEVLVKARLLLQVVNDEIEISYPKAEDRWRFFASKEEPVQNGREVLSKKEQKKIAEQIRSFADLKVMRNILSGNGSLELRNIKALLRPATGYKCCLADFWTGQQLSVDKLTSLRNQLMHFCLWIPKDIAQSCIDLTQANLDDFTKNWMSSAMPGGQIEQIKWNNLLKVCDLHFLPASHQGEA